MKSISYEEFQQDLPYWLAYLRDGGELSVCRQGRRLLNRLLMTQTLAEAKTLLFRLIQSELETIKNYRLRIPLRPQERGMLIL